MSIVKIDNVFLNSSLKENILRNGIFVDSSGSVKSPANQARVVTQEATGASGNQNFVAPEWNKTPTAAIVMVSRSTSSGFPINNASVSIGFATNTTQAQSSMWTRNGFTASDGARYQDTGAVVRILDGARSGDGSVEAEAIASFSENTVTLNWTNPPSINCQTTVIMLDALDAEVISIPVGSDVTNLSFQPNCVFLLANGATTTFGSAAFSIISFGATSNSQSGIRNMACSYGSRDGAAITLVNTAFYNANNNSQAVNNVEAWRSSISSFTSNGFTGVLSGDSLR